jgi:hypothetical protein
MPKQQQQQQQPLHKVFDTYFKKLIIANLGLGLANILGCIPLTPDGLRLRQHILAFPDEVHALFIEVLVTYRVRKGLKPLDWSFVYSGTLASLKIFIFPEGCGPKEMVHRLPPAPKQEVGDELIDSANAIRSAVRAAIVATIKESRLKDGSFKVGNILRGLSPEQMSLAIWLLPSIERILQEMVVDYRAANKLSPLGFSVIREQSGWMKILIHSPEWRPRPVEKA